MKITSNAVELPGLVRRITKYLSQKIFCDVPRCRTSQTQKLIGIDAEEEWMNVQRRYYSYLVRLWPESTTAVQGERWRASLENPHTGEVIHFTSLKHLFQFLEDQTSTGEAPNKSTRGGGSGNP